MFLSNPVEKSREQVAADIMENYRVHINPIRMAILQDLEVLGVEHGRHPFFNHRYGQNVQPLDRLDGFFRRCHYVVVDYNNHPIPAGYYREMILLRTQLHMMANIKHYWPQGVEQPWKKNFELHLIRLILYCSSLDYAAGWDTEVVPLWREIDVIKAFIPEAREPHHEIDGEVLHTVIGRHRDFTVGFREQEPEEDFDI